MHTQTETSVKTETYEVSTISCLPLHDGLQSFILQTRCRPHTNYPQTLQSGPRPSKGESPLNHRTSNRLRAAFIYFNHQYLSVGLRGGGFFFGFWMPHRKEHSKVSTAISFWLIFSHVLYGNSHWGIQYFFCYSSSWFFQPPELNLNWVFLYLCIHCFPSPASHFI